MNKKDLSEDFLKEQLIVGFIFHRFNNAIILVTRDGSLNQINLADYSLECLGEEEAGFLTAELSPCEEFLILATGSKNLILFDKEFNIVDEKPLDDGEGTSKDFEIDFVKIIWRFDSNYFSVHYGNKTDGVKNLTKDKYLATHKSPSKSDPEGGLVQSVCEKLYPNLGQSLTWIPNGSLIMSHETNKVGKKDNIKKIIMWEKNGLKHGEIILPDNIEEKDDAKGTFEVIDMKWNKNSKILTILVEENSKNYIFVYTRSNYHWFLKNRIDLKNEKIVNMEFSIKKNNECYVTFRNGSITRLHFSFEYQIGSYTDKKKVYNSLVCSTDYKSLNLTPLSTFVPPPPMSHHKEVFEAQISNYFFTTDYIGIIFSQKDSFRVEVYSYGFSDEIKTLGVNKTIESSFVTQPLIFEVEGKLHFS